MSRKASPQTELRNLKRRFNETLNDLNATRVQSEAYRSRATKAEQECAAWSKRFDMLLARGLETLPAGTYALKSGGKVTIDGAQMQRLKDAGSGDNVKIPAIKEARAIWNLSLIDAKELVEDLGDAGKLNSACGRTWRSA